MPVLRKHHVVEIGGDAIDERHHLIAVGHSKRAAGHEVVLHVDDDEAGSYFFGSRIVSTSARSAAL